MKITASTSRQSDRIPRTASGLVALLIASCVFSIPGKVCGQSAESLNRNASETTAPATATAPSPAATPSPTAKEKPSAPTIFKPMQPGMAVGMASRFVTPEDLGPYVQSMTEMFVIRDRATDPFGQPQDPDAKPALKPEVAKKSNRVTQLKATPFAEIARLIKVTTVMPAEKRFLVGTRSIREGQKFPINFRSKPINVLVVSVSSRQILLQNTDTNETATLDLNLLPVGMTPGTKGLTAPGMIQDSPNAAIELEGDTLPSQEPVNQ